MKSILKIYFVFFISFHITTSFSQSVKAYYVSTQILNFRKEPHDNAKIMYYLNLYDNIKVIDSVHYCGWSKIIANNDTGFVSHKFIKRGFCVVHTYNVKVGVECKDGFSFDMLNRNICASHGGFSHWITEPRKSVQIVKD